MTCHGHFPQLELLRGPQTPIEQCGQTIRVFVKSLDSAANCRSLFSARSKAPLQPPQGAMDCLDPHSVFPKLSPDTKDHRVTALVRESTGRVRRSSHATGYGKARIVEEASQQEMIASGPRLSLSNSLNQVWKAHFWL